MASTTYFHGIKVVPGEGSFQPTVRAIETAIIGLIGTSSTDTSGKTTAPVLIRSIEEAEAIFGKVKKENQDTIPRALAAIYKYGNFPVVVVNADTVDQSALPVRPRPNQPAQPGTGNGTATENAASEEGESSGGTPAANGNTPVANGNTPAANGNTPAANGNTPAANSNATAKPFSFDASTKKDKVKAACDVMKRARGELTYEPKILIAPSFSSDKDVANALIDLAQSLKAVAVIDGPNDPKLTGAEVKKGVTGQELDRAYIVEPWEEIGEGDFIGSSASVSALIASLDRSEGFWVSPSNKLLRNYKPARGIGFSFTDEGSEANQYNAEGVACVVYEQGYRLWGARSIGDATKPTKFLNVLRTADVIAESILKSHLWAVDRGITKSYTQLVTESVNGFLRDLTALGAILGGTCSPSPKNSESFIKDGRVFFQYEFTPVYPAEQVTFEYYITDTRLLGVFES
jgi:phage tail sheath protein FI